MKAKHFLILILASVTFLGCGKNSSSNTIDVGCIPWTDNNGNDLGIYPGGGCPVYGGAYSSDTLTPNQLALFQSLDTAGLPNTTIPDSILIKYIPFISPSIYPSPIVNSGEIVFNYTGSGINRNRIPFPSPAMFKYVIVDSLMQPMDKGAKLLQGHNVSISPNLPIGRYRLYLTLSTLNNPNFYQSFFNIEKIQ